MSSGCPCIGVQVSFSFRSATKACRWGRLRKGTLAARLPSRASVEMVLLHIVCSQRIDLALILPTSPLQTEQHEGRTENTNEGKFCSIDYNLRLQ
jgi:hypothetical protein